jgi:hypothetical protein
MTAWSNYANPRLTLKRLGFTRSTLGGSAWGAWGSTGRLEMTPSSDVDWFCWDPEGRLMKVVEEIRYVWAENTPNMRLDLIHCTTPAVADNFALTNGTDFHCLYFLTIAESRTTQEQQVLQQQQMLKQRSDIRSRDIVHLLIALYSFQKTFLTATNQTAKFALGGTRSWTTLAQFAALRWPAVLADSTSAGLITLADAIGTSRTRLLNYWRRSFKLRSKQETGQLNPEDMSRELGQLADAWQRELSKTIDVFLPWIQENAGITESLLVTFLHRLGIATGPLPSPRIVSDEVEKMVCAFLANDEKVLVSLAKDERRWWPLHAILMNRNAPAHLLHNLAFPSWRQDWWPWRNIILYVAKHPNTNAETLTRIAATRGLRPMDYVAAQRALAGKRISHA